MANVSEFDIIGSEKFEDDAIGAIYPKAPDFAMLRMQLLGMERRMKRGSRKRLVLVSALR